MEKNKETLKIGDPAPDFCLSSSTGDEVCLKDLKGKWVVLYFYPKDNTPGCTKESKEFSNNLEKIKKMGSEVFGISKDSIKSHCKFAEKHSLMVPLLSDLEVSMIKDYKVWKPKKMFGKEFLGVVRATYIIGPDGKIAHVWPKVKVTGHVEDVMAKLRELM